MGRARESVRYRFNSFGSGAPGTQQKAAQAPAPAPMSAPRSRPVPSFDEMAFPPLTPRKEMGGIGDGGGLSGLRMKSGPPVAAGQPRVPPLQLMSARGPKPEPLVPPLALGQKSYPHHAGTKANGLTNGAQVASRSCLTHRPASNSGGAAAAAQEAVTASQQQLASMQARLFQAQRMAQKLRDSCQQLGFEVASSLDHLHDDLHDLEVLQEASAAQQERLAAAAAVDPEEVTSAAQQHLQDEGDNVSLQGCSPSPSGGTDVLVPMSEKLVVLRARREHVETAFLHIMRTMVTGLEDILTLCGTSGGGSGSAGGADKISISIAENEPPRRRSD